MAQRSVFIGLVSYSKSAFVESKGSEGLARQLSVAFEELGIQTHVQINTSDLFNQNSFPLTPKMARDSVWREIQLESDWFHFLKKPRRLAHLIRIAGRQSRFLLNWRSNSETTELRRLLNIEYSHVDLYRAALKCGSDWAVILEDDAYSSDPVALATCLNQLMNVKMPPRLINLSSSYSLEEIGISHLMSGAQQHISEFPNECSVLQSQRPATNTVCAIAFRTEFLAHVLADFDSRPAEPVVPIDWKLNAALMRLWDAKLIGPNECWFVEPAPIIQLSMVRDREGK